MQARTSRAQNRLGIIAPSVLRFEDKRTRRCSLSTTSPPPTDAGSEGPTDGARAGAVQLCTRAAVERSTVSNGYTASRTDSRATTSRLPTSVDPEGPTDLRWDGARTGATAAPETRLDFCLDSPPTAFFPFGPFLRV